MTEGLYQQKAFDSQAKTYDKLYGDKSDFEKEMIKERKRTILGSPIVENSLDLGCGTGIFLGLISKRSKTVYGVDISEGMLEEAIKRKKQEGICNVQIKFGDAYALPFKESFFDKVYCINTFCHIKDSKKALAEISRVLKKEGSAYIEFYDLLNPFVFLRSLANPFFKGHPFVYGNYIPSLKKCAEENGLKVTGFKVIFYIETGEAIKKWLPDQLFVLLGFYKKLAERFSFLQFTRCVMVLRKKNFAVGGVIK